MNVIKNQIYQKHVKIIRILRGRNNERTNKVFDILTHLFCERKTSQNKRKIIHETLAIKRIVTLVSYKKHLDFAQSSPKLTSTKADTANTTIHPLDQSICIYCRENCEVNKQNFRRMIEIARSVLIEFRFKTFL